MRRSASVLLFGFVLTLLGAQGVVRAQPVDPVGQLYDRGRVSLNGDWHYLVEPFGQALRNRNSRRDFPADRVAAPGELVEYEWDSAPTLTVPGDFNHQDPQLWLYEGPVWVRKRFETPQYATSGDGGRVFLHFEAANYMTHVFLNDEKLGVHEGGFTPFAFDVTDRLRADGENSLVVAVDNSRRDDGVPARRTDWWNYGGLTRPVWLVLTPETYVHDLAVRFLDDGAGGSERVEARVEVAGPDADGADVTVSIPEVGLAAETRANSDGEATVTFQLADVGVERWSPENPKRYEVVVETAEDRVAENVGFRTVATRGSELLLNGQPVFLRGVSTHEEAFDARGRRATTDADLLALFEAAMSVNANFVRLAHYPYSERAAALADSLGLLLWAEIPVYWEEIDYASPQTLATARAMLRAMLDRDENRASVILWSVANETPITEDRMHFLRTLIGDVRTYDPTRLVTAALKSSSIEAAAADGAGGRIGDTGGRANSLVQRVDDPLGAYLDVLAVNTYVGWYGSRTPAEIAEVSFEVPYDKPLVLSEFGAGAVAGLHGPTDEPERWTEEYQAALVDHTMAVALGTPEVVGTVPWVLKDFRSPRRWHPRYQQFWNRKGLFSETGTRKHAADVLLRWYDRLEDGDVPAGPLGL
ncbi:MAG: glycoside hydrolase family 2 TIM barrel-domain containing protein [Bacteroidota bacterium]